MRTLVTGAGGLIGRNLVARLVADGVEVRAMVRPTATVDPADLRGAEIVRGDVTSAADVDRCTAGCQRVFHLAAKVGHGADRDGLWEPNVQGTRHVAAAAARAGVRRMIYVSSASVYGRAVSRHGLTEVSAPSPDSPYGQSKLAAETLLLEAWRRDGLPVVIARTATVVGPGAVAWLGLAKSLAEGRFRMAGSGQRLHTVTDSTDFIDGLMLCAQAPAIEGEVFLITGAAPVTLRAWVDAMAIEAGAAPPPGGMPDALLRLYGAADRASLALTHRRLPKADRLDLFLGDRSFDLSKTRRVLGFDPKIDGPEAARRLVRWYRRTGLL